MIDPQHPLMLDHKIGGLGEGGGGERERERETHTHTHTHGLKENSTKFDMSPTFLEPNYHHDDQ
jgi:hypothetical protein